MPGWNADRAEFEAKLAYDVYWGEATREFNRRLVVYTGRLRLRASAEAMASDLDFVPSSELSLQSLMENPVDSGDRRGHSGTDSSAPANVGSENGRFSSRAIAPSLGF
jgi:hypothetical protein